MMELKKIIGEKKWLAYFKNDALCTAYSYARYNKCTEEIPGFSVEDCLSAPGLGWKNFNGMRDENDDPIYNYNDKHLGWFVRQSKKRTCKCF